MEGMGCQLSNAIARTIKMREKSDCGGMRIAE